MLRNKCREVLAIGNTPFLARIAHATPSLAPGPVGHQTTFFSSELEIHRGPHRRHYPALENLKFGERFTDHMLVVEHERGDGWGKPVLKPFGPLQLHPASPGLHYGISCFEGMKAYLGPQGGLLFRPEMNMKRFQRACARLSLAHFDSKELLRCIKHLLRLDRGWMPLHPGHSLYIRPFAFAASHTLGVAPPSRTVVSVIMSPVGPYFPSGLKPISLFVDERHVRAWPGGVGHLKLAGNYAPTIAPQIAAAQHGAQQALYVLPPRAASAGASDPLDAEVSECGTMNMFFVFKSNRGLEVATPPTDGTILPGVTRDSVLHLAGRYHDVEVAERHLTLRELRTAALEGRLVEAFGTGTACSIQPVTEFKRLDSRGNLEVFTTLYGPDDERSLANRLKKDLDDIQTGRVKHDWSVPFE